VAYFDYGGNMPKPPKKSKTERPNQAHLGSLGEIRFSSYGRNIFVMFNFIFVERLSSI
jgi:hypothetical protein